MTATDQNPQQSAQPTPRKTINVVGAAIVKDGKVLCAQRGEGRSLAGTRIYVKALKAVKEAGVTVKACSHITGGGFYENVPRMLKEGTHAVINKNSYPIPPIFTLMAKKGNIEEHMMYNTYNMGLGMIVAVDPADVDKTMEAMKAAGDTPYVVGTIEAGEKGVTLC